MNGNASRENRDAKAAEYARSTAAAEVSLATTRALKAGVPRRALAIGMARMLGLALVPVVVNAATNGKRAGGNE